MLNTTQNHNEKKRDLVIFSMGNFIDWPPNGFFVTRNYHILQQLKKSEKFGKILVIDFLPFDLRKQLRTFIKVIPAMHKYKNVKNFSLSSLKEVEDGKVFVYTTCRNILNPYDTEIIKEQIKNSEKLLGLKNTVLWSYHPFSAEFFESNEYSYKIFDAVDDWTKHDIHTKNKSRIMYAYNKISKNADTIFGVSEEVIKLFNKNANTNWIPNGVNLDHFMGKKNPPNTEHNEPEFVSEVKSFKGSRVGYLGIIENRLDSKLIQTLAKSMPDIHFVFAGKVFKNFEGKFLEEIRNIHFIDQIAYKDTPKFLRLMDVGIVPHKITEFTKSMNPLKIYEYLASGIPVVTTPVAGSELFIGNISIAKNTKEFESLLKNALSNKSDQNEIQKRINFVSKFSWDARFSEMLTHIKL